LIHRPIFWRRSGLILVEALAALTLTMALALGLLWWRLSAGPIELATLTRHVERELSAARGGRPVKIDRVELAWAADNRALEIKAVGVRAIAANGQIATNSNEVALGLSVSRLLRADIAINRLRVAGGDVAITLAADGSARIAFGGLNAPPDLVVPPAPEGETLRQRVNRILDGLAGVFAPVGAGRDLRGLQITGLRLIIFDERSRAQWRADNADLTLARDGDLLRLNAHGLLLSAKGGAPTRLAITSDSKFTSAAVEIGVDKARLAGLAPDAWLGPLAGLEAPVTAALSAGLDRNNGITRLEGDVAVDRGRLVFDDGEANLDGGRVRGQYDIESDVLLIREAALAGVKTRVNGAGRIENFSALLRAQADKPAPFSVKFESVNLDMPGVFEAPVQLSDVQAEGRFDRNARAIEIGAFTAGVGAAKVNLAGKVYWAADGKGVLRTAASLSGGINGVVSPDQVLALWPVKLGEGARSWLRPALRGGAIRDVRFKADITPAMVAAGILPDKAIDLGFSFTDANVIYVEGMSPIVGGVGRATLLGNRFDLWLDSGRIGALAVSNGRVELPRLNPKGALASFSGRATGEARAMIGLLLESPLDLKGKIPFDLATVVGTGAVDFTIRRPMLKEVPEADYRFAITGRLDGAGGRTSDGKLLVSDWGLDIDGDESRLTLAGPLKLDGSSSKISWTEQFNAAPGDRSRVTFSGRMPASQLVELGYPADLITDGFIGVAARVRGEGMRAFSGDVSLDLTGAPARLPFLPKTFWSKDARAPATARFALTRQADDSLVLSGIEARGPGLAIDGNARILADGRISEVRLSRADIADRATGGARMRLTPEGVFAIDIDASAFNAGAIMAGGSEPAVASALRNDRPPTPLAVTVRAEALEFQSKAVLRNAVLNYTTDGRALRSAALTGADPSGQPVRFMITPRAGEPAARVRLEAPDAGFAWTAITGQATMRGGRAEVDGFWTPGQSGSTGDLKLTISDFSLVNMPVMARLLSSVGSLQGIADTLNGSGIAFTTLEAPMTYNNGKLTLGECRMTGPSLGLTAKGGIDVATGALSIDGVVVPSYGLNSFVSNVPLLGELLASRKGEGVVGMTYSIKGPADQAKVGVNPLSALTPGILRRIFEPLRPRPPARPPPPRQEAANAGQGG
jgi:hypothetical protein